MALEVAFAVVELGLVAVAFSVATFVAEALHGRKL